MITYEVAVYPDGTKKWYLNDTLHREDGPAIEFNDGTKKWFLNGELHREDGPAIEWGGGIMSWFLKGKHQRDGSKHWYLNGKPLTHEEFNTAMNPVARRRCRKCHVVTFVLVAITFIIIVQTRGWV